MQPSSWHLQISLGQSDTLIKPMLIPIIAALLTVSLPSAAADEVARQDPAAIRKYLRDVYSFRPHLLSQRQIAHQIHRLAVRGEDVTAAAFNILGTANFRAFVAQHAVMVGQDYALVVMLLPMDADKWVGEVIKQLEIETSPTAQRSLLLVLWYAQTDVADHALQTFAANTAKPGASRTDARGVIARSQAINRIPASEIPPDSESDLRSKRREVMKRVSDEALLELDQLTLFLMAKRKARPPG